MVGYVHPFLHEVPEQISRGGRGKVVHDRYMVARAHWPAENHHHLGHLTNRLSSFVFFFFFFFLGA
jgi:hypothetical protein